MNKAQTQPKKEKEAASNMTKIKLKEQVDDLKSELEKRIKQYNDDVLGYNIKLNGLEDLLEKKEAENSSEMIKLLSKISELEEILRKKEAEDKQLQEELDYRASKLDEYELKIKHLQEIVANLESRRDRDFNNKIETLQRTLENKSERTLKCLGDILNTFKFKEYNFRESDAKTPAAMESLIKMWQKSDEQSKILQERNSNLEVHYKASIQQLSVLKLLLYKNINARCNFHVSHAKMFENSLRGLVVDLNGVLPRLSQETRPNSKECLSQIQFLNIEILKYQKNLRDLKFFRLHIDEVFLSNNVTSKLETMPEIAFFIPASVLHVRYMGMLEALRQQNQFNLLQVHVAYQQQFKGMPLSMLPYPNNVPVPPQILQIPAVQMVYNKSESPVVIEESSDRNIRYNSNRSADSENSTISSNSVEFEKTPNASASNSNENLSNRINESQNTNLNHQENLIQNNNNNMQATLKTEEDNSPENSESSFQLLPKMKSFKLCSKTREFIPTSVLAKRAFENIKNNVSAVNNCDNTSPFDSNLNQDITSTKRQENAIACQIKKTTNQSDLLKPDSIDYELTITKDSVEYANFPLITSNEQLENIISAAALTCDSMKVENPNKIEVLLPPENHFEQTQETETSDRNFIESSRSSSRNFVETMDDPDKSVVQKLGSKNSLVKLYYFVKDKAKVDLLNVTDEELVNAILAVKQENTFKGMRKNDILKLIMDFLGKQKETAFENKPNINKFCAICFENNNAPSKTLPCEHTFHNDCLDRWFQQDNICPVCRKLVVTVDDLN